MRVSITDCRSHAREQMYWIVGAELAWTKILQCQKEYACFRDSKNSDQFPYVLPAAF
jgi:hypothetical protein